MNIREYSSLNERVYETKLSNGLTVFVVPKPGFHKKFAIFATKYGNSDRRFKIGGRWTETPTGVAHFLEHKMFDTEYGNALEKLSENGASPNAYTENDMTVYYFECIDKFSDNLEILLSFVSKPYFTKESVEKEQGIISQEIRMYEDDAGYNLYYGLLRSLFKHSPVREPIVGSVEGIASIDRDMLYDCHKVFYSPSNMVLCVVGDVDVDEVSDIAAKILPETSCECPERDYGLPESVVPEIFEGGKAMDISLPIFLAGSKTKPPPHGVMMLKNDIISALSLDLLAGHSSPLYQRLYADGLVSTDFSASYDAVSGVAYTLFGSETREPQRVFNEVMAEIQRLLADGSDAALFERIKKATTGSFIRSLNSFGAIATGLAEGYFYDFDTFEIPEILSKITVEDINKYFEENLVPENFAMYTIYPNNN